MARLESYFPKSHGRPRVDDRRDLIGIIFINRNGLRWRDVPMAYGPNKTLYNQWKRWSDKGVFAGIMAGLASPKSIGSAIPRAAIKTGLAVLRWRCGPLNGCVGGSPRS